MSDSDKKTIGRILLEQQAVSPAALEKALAEESPLPLASRLTETGAVSELEALKALSTQRGVPGIDLNQVCIKLADLNVLPREIALRHKLLPVLEREDRIFCAMANPEDKKALEELEFVTGKRIFAYIALERALVRAIRDAYDLKERGEAFYAGPDCPAEVLMRAGIVREPTPPPAAAAPPPAPKRPEPSEPQRPARPAPPAPKEPPQEAPLPMLAPSPPPVAKPALKLEPPRAGGEVNRERRFRPSSTSIAIPTQVVIDDKMSKVVDTEINEADFGDVARELSVIAELPKEPQATPTAPGKKKILVVDDEMEIRKLLRRVFEESDYVVVEADRGRAALQSLKLESPDLVILDAMLPEIHGFDIARRIRGSTRFAHVPIIMVSAVYRGWRIAEDVKANYGVDAYIEKPFRVSDVVAAVEKALQSRKEPANTESINAEAERLLNDGVAAYRAGDLEKATELLEQGTRVDPLAYRLRFHLGLLYGKRGQVYDAIQQLERAVEIQGKHFSSVKNLAILYQQAGFKNKAVETWQRALAIAPDDETKKSIREHLVGLL